MHFDWSAIQEITRSGPISFEQLLHERSATSAFGAGLLLHFTDVRASVNDRFARPFHKRARSANLKIISRSLTVHQCSAISFPARMRNPPFALVVMPNAIGCAVI
jgi:hypothetical protein